MGLSVNFDTWPLVEVTHHGKRRTVDDTNAMLTALQAALDRGERFAVAYDSSEMRAPEPGTNQILTDYILQHREELAERCVGIGYYLSEPKVLAAMWKAEQTATPEEKAAMPVPTKTYDTWAQARQWAQDRLAEVSPPARTPPSR